MILGCEGGGEHVVSWVLDHTFVDILFIGAVPMNA